MTDRDEMVWASRHRVLLLLAPVGTAEVVLGTTVLGEAAEDWTLTEHPMYAPGAARAFAEWYLMK